MTLQWGNLQGEALIAVAKDYVDFQMYLKRIIEKRRNDPTDDLISALVQMTQEGERSLSDAEIVGLMMGVIGAGHETTTNMLTLTLWQLLQNRAQWLAICTDKALIPSAVEEGLRFDSPAPSMWRRTTREVVLAGVRIPANERICVQLASGNRDELAFSDPASFDIRRKMQPTHLAFGHGIHFCVGAALARLEGRITFEALASKLPSLRLARDFTPSFRPNPTLRFMQRLPIAWDER